MKKYTIELTEREILLLNSWLDIIKKEKPNYYNEYTHTVFDIFKNEVNKIWDNMEKQYDKIIEDINQRKRNEESDRQYAFNFFEKILFDKFKEIDAIGVTDNNTEDFRVSPRYDIDVVILTDLPLGKLEKLDDEIYTFVQDANYSNRKTYEYDFEYRHLSDKIKDIKDCTYKYYR